MTFGPMYGLYSRAASNQERPMMARVRYTTLYPGRNIKVAALLNQDIKLYYFFDRSKRYSIIACEVFRAGIQKFNSRRIKKTPKLVFETQCFEGLSSLLDNI